MLRRIALSLAMLALIAVFSAVSYARFPPRGGGTLVSGVVDAAGNGMIDAAGNGIVDGAGN
jgi:hypothetical protein